MQSGRPLTWRSAGRLLGAQLAGRGPKWRAAKEFCGRHLAGWLAARRLIDWGRRPLGWMGLGRGGSIGVAIFVPLAGGLAQTRRARSENWKEFASKPLCWAARASGPPTGAAACIWPPPAGGTKEFVCRKRGVGALRRGSRDRMGGGRPPDGPARRKVMQKIGAVGASLAPPPLQQPNWVNGSADSGPLTSALDWRRRPGWKLRPVQEGASCGRRRGRYLWSRAAARLAGAQVPHVARSAPKSSPGQSSRVELS